MTQSLNRLSRRNMFSLTAGGASVLALGRVLGGTAHAAGPKLIAESKLPAGGLSVAGDAALDTETLALTEKILARTKHAVLTAVTNPKDAPKDDKLVAAASRLVGELRTRRLTRLQANLKQGPALQALGEYAAMKPAQMNSVLDKELVRVVDLGKLKVKVKKEKQEKEGKVKIKKKKPEEQDEPRFEGPLATRIEFQLNSVKCVDGTSGESGSDEILLGGHIITPGGVIKKIDRFKVSDDFDPGETRYYDYSRCGDVPLKDLPSFMQGICPNGGPNDRYHGRKLGATMLGVDLPWPATLGVVLVMGEEDPGGGFGKFLEEAYGAIKKEVDKKLTELGIELGGAAAGELGSSIGAAIAKALSELIAWLVNLFDNPDDRIGAEDWIVQLPSPEMSAIRALSNDNLPAPGGLWASPMKKLKFNGDGGKYEVRLHWRVNT